MRIKKMVLNLLHDRINAKNQERLQNTTPTLIYSNCAGGDELLKRFDALPYAHKVVFVSEPMESIKSAAYLKNYGVSRKNLYRTISVTGKRCIDQFDYVEFINTLKEKK
mgnify:FL=1